MNWIKTHLTNKTIASLAVGIIIGGIAMGLLNANRPTPLFSDASFGDSVPGCEYSYSSMMTHIENANRARTYDYYIAEQSNYEGARATYEQCVGEVFIQLLADVNEIEDRIQQMEPMPDPSSRGYNKWQSEMEGLNNSLAEAKKLLDDCQCENPIIPEYPPFPDELRDSGSGSTGRGQY